MPESNFEVDLDDLRRVHEALGRVVAVNEQVARTVPAPDSPATGNASSGSVVAAAPRAIEAYTALVGRLAVRQRQGIEAIGETRRRLVDIEAAYRAADRL